MVDSFLAYLKNEKRLSTHTYTAYQKDLSQFSEFLLATFETEEPEKATYREIRSWVVSLSKLKLANTSINRKIASLRAFYAFLLRKKKLSINPMLKIQALKTPSRPPVFIPESNIHRLLDQVTYENNFGGKRDQMILELLYGTGIRLSELINIKPNDLDLFDGRLSVLGKGNKYRLIPLTAKIKAQVENYLSLRKDSFENPEEFVFLTNKGKKLYPLFVQRLTKKYLTLVSTQSKKSPHVLRHTFATHLLNKGADLNAIKELLGHASLAATQIYTHNSIAKLKEIHKKAHPKAD